MSFLGTALTTILSYAGLRIAGDAIHRLRNLHGKPRGRADDVPPLAGAGYPTTITTLITGAFVIFIAFSGLSRWFEPNPKLTLLDVVLATVSLGLMLLLKVLVDRSQARLLERSSVRAAGAPDGANARAAD